MKPPIVYFGGKATMSKTLAPAFDKEPHRRYVEVFGGSIAVLLAEAACER